MNGQQAREMMESRITKIVNAAALAHDAFLEGTHRIAQGHLMVAMDAVTDAMRLAMRRRTAGPGECANCHSELLGTDICPVCQFEQGARP